MSAILVKKQRVIDPDAGYELRGVGWYQILAAGPGVIQTSVTYNILELPTPTKEGSTHAAFDEFGSPVFLLRRDPAGKWMVDVNASNDIVVSIIEEKNE